MRVEEFRRQLAAGIPDELPPLPAEDPAIDRAPARRLDLTPAERRLALHNALRYFHPRLHAALAPEFAAELSRDGRIYMRRYRPADDALRARPLDAYPARSRQAAALMLMIHNNLDPAVAQHPYELITYGGNGTVFQNWAQYLLAMQYLAEMSDEQTLVLYSGHPLGLFPSSVEAPRLVLTCGMVVPNHSRPEDYQRLAALGVTSYGQMTAGSFMYIGPQGIVHGTTITLLNAARRYLGSASADLAGRLFVSSGLGGMSGAQAKAAVIAGGIGVIAEINPRPLKKRLDQGWLQEAEADLDRVLARIERARRERRPLSLGYLGNVVDLWEALVRHGVAVELGSDQTSLHNPYGGGYYPAGLTLERALELMRADPAAFQREVQASLRRQVEAINALAARGLHFWDYGNAFLLEAARAGAAVGRTGGGFRYPSYVEDIMGPVCFDYGFGPFRWICTSGRAEDLRETDRIAADELERLAAEADPQVRGQIEDNLRWIRQADEHRLVVGTQARILYSDEPGRKRLALAFNQAIREGRVSAPVVLGRDHHDVSGADSPYRETADLGDGSAVCADMTVHTVIGDAFRGATWVSLHNGGGVGWGEALNGGFGLLLDGSPEADRRVRAMLAWDVTNGLARRAWGRHPAARFAVGRAMAAEPGLRVTLPHEADGALVDAAARAAGLVD
ncbi:MAG TPA: urocanate hydratase [Candidatus Polarisedimenticolaceae bacterium]|nr:urocanate hydratase [Candidatus Polarisedimenticolaceae bacterium]